MSKKMNDPQEIKVETGYYPGNVYIYDKDKGENEPFYSPERYDDPCTYDGDSGNFHIIPKNTDYIVSNNTKHIDPVRDARTSIIELLKKDTERISTNGADQSKMQLCPHIAASSPNEHRKKIELAVCIKWKGNSYLLCFERLYTHKDKVHCMLGLFQFYKYPTADDNINMVNGSFSMCYPASYKNNIKKQVGNHIVFNPQLPSIFEINENNNLETVREAFINFIQNN